VHIRLTLNLGIRWEHQPPVTEQHDRLSSWNPTKRDPETGRLGPYDFAGNCSVCTGKRSFHRASYRDLTPRFGFTFRPRKNYRPRIEYKRPSVRSSSRSRVIAGVACAISSRGLTASFSNFSPAATTNVLPSSLRQKILSL
jgi:hypothetical protein